MLPDIGLYKKMRTEAGEPLETYQALFDRVGKTFDATKQASDGFQLAMANIKVPTTNTPILQKYKEELSNSLSNIAKEATDSGDYAKASNKVHDLGMKFMTDPTLKHLQEQYAAQKADMDILNSAKKNLYVGGEGVQNFSAVNPDGTFNTYKSTLEERMDWNKSADAVTKELKPVVDNLIESLSPEEKVKFGASGDGILKFVQRESLTNKQFKEKADQIFGKARRDPALEQYARFNGGWGAVEKLVEDNFNIGTYSMDKVDYTPTGKLSGDSATKTTSDDTDAAFQFSEFGTIRNNINSESFKTFDTNAEAYGDNQKSKEDYAKEMQAWAKSNKEGMPPSPPKSFKIDNKDKEFLTMIKNSNKVFKDMPLNKVAEEVNKNKESYVAEFKKNFGQQNMLIDVANKIEVGSGFDKTAKSIALNSRNVLVEGADPKDKGKTLKDQLDSLGLDVSDLEGANKEVVGINIDAMSDDADYNGGLVTQITTKDGSKTFKVVSYNETYKNTFKGFANVKKDLMRIGNTERQKKQLESGYAVESESFYKVGDTQDGKKVEAKAVKRIINGVLTTGIKLKIGDDVTDKPYDVGAFDKMITNLLANDKYFKTNFK